MPTDARVRTYVIPEFVTVPEAAVAFRCSSWTIRQMIKDGRLEAERRGRKGYWLIPISALPHDARGRLQHGHNGSDRRPR